MDGFCIACLVFDKKILDNEMLLHEKKWKKRYDIPRSGTSFSHGKHFIPLSTTILLLKFCAF